MCDCPLFPGAMDAQRRQLCPRLLDYLVVVGARTPGRAAPVQPPELLRRYPPDDHKVRCRGLTCSPALVFLPYLLFVTCRTLVAPDTLSLSLLRHLYSVEFGFNLPDTSIYLVGDLTCKPPPVLPPASPIHHL